MTQANPVSVRERATEGSDKLGRYLNARKLRNAPPPPEVPPPPEEALLLPPEAPPAAQPPPLAVPGPAPPPLGRRDIAQAPPLKPPRRPGVKRRRLDAADGDGEVELFDQDVLYGVYPKLRGRARQVLNRIREARVPGITFGPHLGEVYVNGRPLNDMADLLNDALGTRITARSLDSPGYQAFTRLLEGARVPPQLLSAPYQTRFPILRSVGDDGEVGDVLRAWQPVRTRRGIKQSRIPRRSIMPRWQQLPN